MATRPIPRARRRTTRSFTLAIRVYGFWEYVRIKMAGAGLKYNPVTEMQSMMNALCDDFKDRVQSVQDAVDNHR